MTRTSRWLGAVSSFALVALSTNAALAAGTDAGTPIQNTVSVTFDVGGVTQPSVSSNTDEFVVDRKVNVTVAEVGGSATIVTPGAVQQVTTFQVTNLSNDTLDYELTVANQSGGTSAFGDTDNFDVTSVLIYVDTDNDGDWTDETATTYIDELAADTSQTVFVVASVPLGQATGDVSTVTLTADGHAGGGAGSLGTELTTSATNDASVVDTVLADGSGDTDADYDGAYSASDDYKVSAASISAVKSSTIISDPITDVTGGTPKAIPGAVVEYCILVTNASGSADATNISVSDDVPAEVTRDNTFGVVLQTSCSDTSNPGTGSFADPGANGKGVASGNLGTLSAGETRALLFRATID
ncbi:MAG: hypothetical protein H6920_10155 [Sphingomonadaceae bacterium]|nr:hypothetical protein [Sphingomonadaceae bacterium]MCP5385065.1 hypothetical protein [Altererythrobacter sp.]MCP5391966.1 hypothetical protein [Sphingomonadaceae bacterium]MCP5394118.1 hypothetical protein [Sphingomonadaceae bacterium]